MNNVFAHCPTNIQIFPFFLLYLECVFQRENRKKSTKMIEKIKLPQEKKILNCVLTPGDEKH